MNELIKQKLNTPLGAKALMKLVKRKCNIWIYEELAQMNSIDDLFLNKYKRINDGDPLPCIILIEFEKNSTGHWISVCPLKNNNVEVFDSYGIDLDKQLDKIVDPRVSDYPFLTELLYKSNVPRVISNKKRLQGKYSQVCGRYCGLRIITYFKNMNLREFVEIFLNSNDPDVLAVLLTFDI